MVGRGQLVRLLRPHEPPVRVASALAFPLLRAPAVRGGPAARRDHELGALAHVPPELVFQIPHNVFVSALEARKGSLVEWPFYSYGLSDSRWSSYSIALKNEGGSAVGSNSSQKAGLDPAVWLINANDASLGFLVLYAWVLMQAQTKTQVAREKKGEDVAAAAKKEKKGREGEKQQQPQSAWQAVRRWLQQLKLLPTVGTPGLTSVLTSVDWELACALLLVFRDGTLFRE
eukprot:CAMPEP_0171638712 /NCGR_PEP_ID=MMETSP0990-20121206/29173_1 /TAXON_ID=483369 /ORGANISM="non described non described, Strain CCMP2098" /LENGTH=229 /DNA_ID=CAMNT_0012212095 /DNA_START=73 /DNA_END=763 /DNA_ORIENTATION=+